MYLNQISPVANMEKPEEAHIRPQFSYFIHRESSIWESFVEKGSSIRIEKGKFINYEKDYIYFLRKGLVRFARSSGDESLPLFYLGRNSLFFEMHAIGHTAAPCTCRTIEDCSIVRFPASLIRQAVLDNPQLSFNLMESIGAKYSVLLTRVSEIGSHNLLRNIARLILDMAALYNFNSIFVPPISQIELTEFFCVHRSSINRAIAVLREKKLLGDYTKKRLEILDLQQLIQLAAVTYL